MVAKTSLHCLNIYKMVINFIVSNNTGIHHKLGSKCCSRFFDIDNNLLSISLPEGIIKKKSFFGNKEIYTEDFKTKTARLQEMFMTSFCQKCCKDVINDLQKIALKEAVTLSENWFSKNRKIVLIRKYAKK